MMLIDSHCHLSFKDYPPDEIPTLLDRAREAGVSTLVTIGAGEGFEGNEQALQLAEKYPQIYCTIGMHPHDASLVDENLIERIETMATHPKVRAIGEIGLDFYYEHSPREAQEKAFHSFIDLAFRVEKPIMIHDRGAGNLTYRILKEKNVSPGQVMIHCFTGTQELARSYLDLGCYLSFTGIITFKKAEDLREVVRLTPLDRMLIETDSPYLTPEPFRGKRNEPAYVRYVAERVAQVKGLTLEAVAEATYRNAQAFFKLPTAGV